MAISPLTFYESSKRKAYSSDIERRIEEHLAKKFKKCRKLSPLALNPYHQRLLRPWDVWQRFSKQAEAFDFLNDQIMLDERARTEMRIFAREEDACGKRFYVVTTLRRFLHNYQRMEDRHWYEVIMNGYPCRLYFDIEFYEKFNKTLKHPTCMLNFKAFLAEMCRDKLGLEICDQDILELCGSRPGKFSRHLILHLNENKVMHSNWAVGQFVDDIVAVINHDQDKFKKLGILVSKDETCSLTPIFDSAVYSKNRNFRLVLSSKMGPSTKGYPLKVADNCLFYGKTSGRLDSQENVITDSLITILDNDCDDIVPVYLPESFDYASSSSSNSLSHLPNKTIPKSNLPSMFPQLDSFILDTVIRPRNNNGFIRHWRAFKNEDWSNIDVIDADVDPEADMTVVYEIGGARYCINIGREHKSNHVKWLVNVKRRVYYQKCNDPDCRSFCSNEFPLPHDLLTDSKENALTDSDDELLQFVQDENL